MSRRNTTLLKAALDTLRITRADRILAPMTTGAGVIFMLHHVAPDTGHAFEPNRILRVTPQFLDEVIREVRALGFDLVSLDAVPERLAAARKDGGARRPFACFTLDDGYRDNRDYALPVFEAHNCPFTIYVPTDYADGNGELWWLTLENAIRKARTVTLTMSGALRTFETGSLAQKQAAYHEIYWWLRAIPENRARAVVSELATSLGLDPNASCRELVMNWDELRQLADHPLVTIGAHTRSHYALSKLDENDARSEMRESIARIEDELATPCHHFSFPYGSAEAAGAREFRLATELGVATAVTTRKGLLHADHADGLTALPRLSLNGDFQDVRYIRTLLSGAPFALMKPLGLGRKPTLAATARSPVAS